MSWLNGYQQHHEFNISIVNLRKAETPTFLFTPKDALAI
jgi:hypothetical protein